jgi:hypothetical protein
LAIYCHSPCEFKKYVIAMYSDKLQQQKKVWRYHRGNQKLYINEGQTIQWPKEPEALKSLYRSPGYSQWHCDLLPLCCVHHLYLFTFNLFLGNKYAKFNQTWLGWALFWQTRPLSRIAIVT